MPAYTEVKHYYVYDVNILAAVGVFHRMRLGLAPDEIAAILQVSFILTPNGLTQFFQALSGDPDEEANIGRDQVLNDQNMMAVRGFELLGVVGNGPLCQDTLVMPIPGGGIDTAGDVMYLAGVALNVTDVMHGCSVYYQRRKAKPGEREALIMAQR